MTSIQTPGVGEFLTLDDYLALCKEQGPEIHLRGAAGMLRDMLDFHGHHDQVFCGEHLKRPKFFDGDTLGFGEYRFVGGTDVLAGLEMTIRGLAIPGADKVIMILKGPPSSGKSILAEMITKGLIQFSTDEDRGAMYTHKFVLPANMVFGSGQSSIGFSCRNESEFEPLDDRGNLKKDVIAIDCEMHNSPIRMLPQRYRLEIFKDIFSLKEEDIQYVVPESYREDCCHNCEGILGALVTQYAKKYDGANKERREKALNDALRHVVVQRFAYSTAGMGIVTVPVNEHLRKGDAVPITDQIKYSKIAQALESLGVRFLGYRGSDHVAANRGVLILEEILQRPDILSGGENDYISRGKLRLGPVSLLCDSVLIGTSNIGPYEAAKNDTQVNSGAITRWSVSSVVHPVRIQDAVELYERSVLHPRLLSKDKHIAPYSVWGLAFWSVTTRLENPREALEERDEVGAEEFSKEEKKIIKTLTIPQKAYLYDDDIISAEISHGLERYASDKFIALLRKRSLGEGEPLPPRILRSGIISPAVYKDSKCLLPTDIFDSVDEFLAKSDNLTEPCLLGGRGSRQDRLKEMHAFLNTARWHTERFARMDVERVIVGARNDPGHALELLRQYMGVLKYVITGDFSPIPNPKMAGTKIDPIELLEPFEDVIVEGGWWKKEPGEEEIQEFRTDIVSRFESKREKYREAKEDKEYDPLGDDTFYYQVYREVLSAYTRGAMAEPIQNVLLARDKILYVVDRVSEMYDELTGRFDANKIIYEYEAGPEIIHLTATYLNGMLDLERGSDKKDSARYCHDCAPIFFGYVIKEDLLLQSLPEPRREKMKLAINAQRKKQ